MAPKKPFTPGARRDRIWHGRDVLFKRLRLKDMHRNGYIDHPSGSFPRIETDNFQARTTYNPHDPHAPFNFIHPIFKPENWVQLAPEDYERISPGLRLASSFLCEPFVLGFFQAMLRPPTRLHDHDGETILGGRLYNIGTSPMNPLSLPWVAQVLVRMQNHVKWHLGGERPLGSAWMSTGSDTTKDGLLPNRSFSAEVHGRPEFLEIFRQNVRASQFAKAENFDDTAAHCRTTTFFAHVLLHELCHVLHRAAVPNREHPTIPNARVTLAEPFYRDDRLAELGWAFQQVVFGGGLTPAGMNPSSAAAPYGMSVLRWPGGISNSSLGKARASPARWGETHVTLGIVDVEWHRKFFTRRFWEKDVARGTSGQIFKVDWTIAIQFDEFTSSAFFPGEPLVSLPQRPDPGVPSREALRTRGFKLKPMKDVDETSIDTDEDQDSEA